MQTLSVPGLILVPGTRIRLRSVQCRSEPRIHPDFPVIMQRNGDWVRRYLPGNDRVFRHNYPLFDAVSYPDGITERVYQSSRITTLMFEADDLAEIGGQLEQEKPDAGDSAFGSAFTSLRRQMRPDLYGQFIAAWRDWHAAVGELRGYHEARLLPDLHTYLPLRRRDVALGAYTLYIEYALGLDEITSLRNTDPELDSVRWHAVDHCMLTNDLYSFRNEALKGLYVNAVAVLRARGAGLQQAFDTVQDAITQAERDMGIASEHLSNRYHDHPEVRRYLRALWDFIAGNLFWSRVAYRYNGPAGWNGLREGTLVMQPGGTEIAAG